jgi:hypothetical protein
MITWRPHDRVLMISRPAQPLRGPPQVIEDEVRLREVKETAKYGVIRP